ncbi:MAG: glycosyltransferase family 4 protein [Candidatus Binatia bacterium]
MIKRILCVEATRKGVQGGSHRCLYELVKGLDRSKYEPIVLLYSDVPIRQEFKKVCKVIMIEKKDRGRSHKGHLRPSRVRTMGRLLSDLFFTILPGTRALYRIIRQERIDIVHLNNALGMAPEGTLAAKLCGIPCVVHQRAMGKVYRIARFQSKYVDALICISDAVRTFYMTEEVSPKRILRIYDGIDVLPTDATVSSEMMRRHLGIESDRPIVGVVGTIQPWKGQREVILAVRQLKNRYPNIRCLIVGEIFNRDYHREISKLVEELELNGNVCFLGYREDVLDLMNAMDIVIHSSTLPEPFGRVLIEAMALGKPIIATRGGGPLEIVEDHFTGLLVPPGDPEALASAVTRLVENGMLSAKMGQAGRERVKQLFTLESTILETEKIYAQL